MSYIHTGLTTATHRPRVDRGSLPATYRGTRVPERIFRSQTRGYQLPYVSGQTASIVGGKKSLSNIMVKYSRKRRTKRRGALKKRIPATLTPRRKLVRCSVTEYVTTDGTSGALDKINISVNDITDPFHTDSTNQPLGYDQWKTLYKQAVVVGGKLTVRAYNPNTYPVMVGVSTAPESQSTTGLSTYEHYMELGGTKARILSPDVDHVTYSKKWSVKKFFGLKKLMDEQDVHVTDLTSQTAPTREGQIHVWAQPLDQTVTLTTSCQFVIKVDYIIMLHDPIIPSRSSA